MDGLEHLRGLVLMKQTGACTGCLLCKGKVTGQPKGKVHRPEAAGRLERMDIDLSGRQDVKSAGHNFNCFVVGVSSPNFRIVTGVAYLSQALFAVKRLFYRSSRSTERN